MKIIYIANVRMPTEKAHGLQIMKMCEAFVKAGHEVDLVVPFRFNPIKINPYKYYRIEPIFRIITLPSLDLLFLNRYISWPRFSIWQYISFAKMAAIYTLFKRVDIIYSRDEAPLFFLSFFKKNLYWEAHVLKNNFLARRLYSRCTKIFVTTDALRKMYMEAGVSPDKIEVSRDAVDLKIFDINISKEDARQKLNLPKDKIILGYTGSFKTMGEEKGLDDILKAIKFLADPKILLVAVGGSEIDIKYYQGKAGILGVENNVIFIGRKSQAELAVYQKACDMLLMPFPNIPHYAYYMSPLKMFEYMASKRPIIASDLPSIREVLNENNALLVKPDDPADLAEKIKYLAERIDVGEKTSAQAFNDVSRFTWSNRVDRILKTKNY